MGYNLAIGNAEVVTDPEERACSYQVVKIERHPEAPPGSWPDEPGFNNYRHTSVCWPSYTVWHGFAREVGLTVFFYGEDGETGHLAEHPGCTPLTTEDAETVEAARDAWVAKHGRRANDWNLRRLDWLAYWIRWAVENCDLPSFYNT